MPSQQGRAPFIKRLHVPIGWRLFAFALLLQVGLFFAVHLFSQSDYWNKTDLRLLLTILFVGIVIMNAVMAIIFTQQIRLFVEISKMFPSMIQGRFARYHQLAKLRESVPLRDEVDTALVSLNETLTNLSDMRAAMEKETRDNVNASLTEKLSTERTRLLTEWARAEEASKLALARDLHDEGGSRLVSIRVDSELIAGLCQENSSVVARAERIGRSCEALAGMIKGVIDQLQPPTIEALGLQGSLNGLASEWRGILEGRCNVSLDINGTLDDLPQVLATTIYRIAQEALTNAAKYAQASRIDIYLKRLDASGQDWVELFVRDNGVGFDPESTHGGTGIKGMRERAGVFGGSLSINSFSSGTVLAVRFPVSS